jgi:anti-sigma factor RsiW
MTGNCGQVHKIAAYHDGELPPEERVRLEEHLGTCADCSRELEGLRGLSRLLCAARAPQMARPALERLHRRVSRAPEGVIVRMAEALAAAAATVLVACSMWMWQASSDAGGYGEPLPDWERVALGGQVDAASAADPQVRLAQWIVEDLSQEDGRD